jgi:hypothetical protein
VQVYKGKKEESKPPLVDMTLSFYFLYSDESGLADQRKTVPLRVRHFLEMTNNWPINGFFKSKQTKSKVHISNTSLIRLSYSDHHIPESHHPRAMY